MKKLGERILWKTVWRIALALLLIGGAGRTNAQAPLTFDGSDWLQDRGNISPFLGPGTTGASNGVPLRLGYNEFFNLAYNDPTTNRHTLNPGPAVRRWVWPFTRDLTNSEILGALPTRSVVDNAYPYIVIGAPKQLFRYEPIRNGYDPVANADNPPFTPRAGLFSPITLLRPSPLAPGSAWKLPTLALGANGDYRTASGGFSFGGDTAVAFNYDYAFTTSVVQGTFPVLRNNGQSTQATREELALLPNANPRVYKAVHDALVADTANGSRPIAVWTCGNLASGRYGIDIHSPGNGTKIDTTTLGTRSNISRVLLRVSWKNTVNADGTLNFSAAPGGGGINDPVNSRIFMVDLGESGWIRIQGGGLGPASFPFGGLQADQLTVTLFALTPDDPNDPIYGVGIQRRPPVITADAVRFIPQQLDAANATGLTRRDSSGNIIFTIAATGRILGSAIGTAKFPGATSEDPKQPLTYLAREESLPESAMTDAPLRSRLNPADETSDASTDPTALSTVPVFYCLDNQNGDVDNSDGSNLRSEQKVLWRYVGVPDSASSETTNAGGSGTSAATPMLANVRCRDGEIRQMVYFTTTNADGSVGHIYALNPRGLSGTSTTSAYFIYPSYRPRLAGDPADMLPVFHDPNYTLPIGVPRVGYPAPSGPDIGPNLYDGDIIRAASGELTVKSDTRVTFGGVQGSPILIEDPDNPTGPQLLVVPNRNGRIYAFDAGGRGDFNEMTGVPGTTQRVWAWPRFSGDAYHISPLISNTANGYVTANPFQNEAAKGAFLASLAFNPNFSGVNSPILAGSGDGHLYALKANRDVVTTFINGIPQYPQRVNWLYPSVEKSLGAALSAPAIFKGNIYFTCAGRVYAVPETPPAGTAPVLNAETWVYPFTSNIPDPIPNDPNSAALDPGFNGTAPVVLDATVIKNRGTTPPAGAPDICYVVQGNGTVLALNAAPTGVKSTTLLTSGFTLTGSNTRSAAIAGILDSQDFFDPDPDGVSGNQPKPVLVIGDDDGALSGIGLVSIDDGTGTGTQILPLLWAQYDASIARSASAILVGGDTFNSTVDRPIKGMIYQGDEGGQFRAYGFGAGVNGLNSTVGEGEPEPQNLGPGLVSIDMRVLDIYSLTDWNNFMRSSGSPAYTPGRSTTGTNFANTKEPRAGNIGPNAFAVDWGDSLHVAAWGVYHAQRPDVPNPGSAPPTVTVTFTVTQPGRGSRPYTVTVPAITPPTDSTLDMARWPDDLGMTNAERNGLTIYAFDSSDSNALKPLTGTSQGVYPWVARFRLHVRPEANTPFVPGGTGYQVTARATIRQAIGGSNARGDSNVLRIGQRDYEGRSDTPNPLPPSRGALGQPKQIYVTHPFALTTRGANDATGLSPQSGPNILGWGADVSLLINAGLTLEVLANGNRLHNPSNPLSTATVKALFAPVGPVQDGASGIYRGVNDATGQAVSALYVADRTMLFDTTGRAVSVQAVSRPMNWLGGPTSVMNPLPWEQMPANGQTTPDYPAIPATALSLQSNGAEMTAAPVPLTPPLFPIGNIVNPAERKMQPNEITLTVKAPRYQPANINRGPVTYSYQDKTYNFGSSYTDISGTTNNQILGPLRISDGLPLPINNGAVPAGGYISEVGLVAVLPGDNTQTPPYIPSSGFNDNPENGTGTGGNGNTPGANTQRAYRTFTTGVTVPPSARMRVVEQTVDLGKLPHGTGYSDRVTGNAPPFYRDPFRPSMAGVASPWDSESGRGVFFRPFTLINESNINLFDVRIAKLLGAPNATIEPLSLTDNPPSTTAAAARLNSDQVNNLANQSLYALPILGSGTGNIGIVSSFDHLSLNTSDVFPENPLWPVANPFVMEDGLQASGLKDALDPWSAGQQRHPTVHKARVGDTQGTTATIPDVPYDFNPLLTSGVTPALPKIGIAVPVGTPSGTYSAPIYAFEDHTPIQWREWLAASLGVNEDGIGRDRDGILNRSVDRSATPPLIGGQTEAFTDPTFTLKATVREARITNGFTPGTLPQVDLTGSPSANLLPAAVRFPSLTDQDLFLYWTTNRNTPSPVSSWGLAFSRLPGPGGDTNFAVSGTGAQWWTEPALFPELTAATSTNLFPSAPNPSGAPFLTGDINANTVRYASPSVALAVNPDDPFDREAYLFSQGEVFKLRGGVGGQSQVTDSRTFYWSLNGSRPGEPINPNAPQSFLNDPALSKLSPKPLLLKVGGQKFLYLFWHTGSTAQTALHYNVNAVNSATGAFETAGWYQQTATDSSTMPTGDQKLPMPTGLLWQSDPHPVYRRVGGVDAIDVVFTGVLRNRQAVEVLLARYRINITPPATRSAAPLGALTLMPLSGVQQETLTRQGATDTFGSRDIAWIVDPANPTLRVQLARGGTVANLNTRSDGMVKRGRRDEATGLIYYDVLSRNDAGGDIPNFFGGGQMVIDPTSGTVSFPNVPPRRNDTLLVSYTPQLMRLSAARGETNVLRDMLTADVVNDPAFRARPSGEVSGDNTNAIVIMDRAPNLRRKLISPAVMFSNTGAALAPNPNPTADELRAWDKVDRLWVMYRKSDPSGTVKAGVYYRSLRLMARLPRPVKLANPVNGVQSIQSLTVTGALGPYEVDWVRGRVYFTELDEGNQVSISYKAADETDFTNLPYRVAWADEISATAANPGLDETTPEVLMPTDGAINEGQATAFKDPFTDKLWVFWASTRAGTTDLFYQTLAPQFYPTASNQF